MLLTCSKLCSRIDIVVLECLTTIILGAVVFFWWKPELVLHSQTFYPTAMWGNGLVVVQLARNLFNA